MTRIPDPLCLTYFTTYDPSLTGAWEWDASGELEPPPLEQAHQWLQLECLNDSWMELEAGRSAVRQGDSRQAGLQAMQAAYHWMTAHPGHPGPAAVLDALGAPPLFLMLASNVLWQSGATAEWVLPGLTGGLYIEGAWPAVPDDAQDEDFNVAGLLGVTLDDRWGHMTGVRLVLCPWSQAAVAQVTSDID